MARWPAVAMFWHVHTRHCGANSSPCSTRRGRTANPPYWDTSAPSCVDPGHDRHPLPQQGSAIFTRSGDESRNAGPDHDRRHTGSGWVRGFRPDPTQTDMQVMADHKGEHEAKLAFRRRVRGLVADRGARCLPWSLVRNGRSARAPGLYPISADPMERHGHLHVLNPTGPRPC